VAQPTEVLTPSEPAAYRRAAEEEVLRLARLQELPGRQIGSEWRVLKAGLQDWRSSSPRDPATDLVILLRQSLGFIGARTSQRSRQ
jgi:hypothetical protein